MSQSYKAAGEIKFVNSFAFTKHLVLSFTVFGTFVGLFFALYFALTIPMSSNDRFILFAIFGTVGIAIGALGGWVAKILLNQIVKR